MKIGLFVSGNLGYDILTNIYQKYNIPIIFTDKNSKEIIDYSILKGIKHFIGNPRNNKAKDIINEVEIDILLSVNYLFIIEKDLIDFPKKYAINIHGSLLPKYRGRTPHVWAIINNEKITGITAHLISEKCDEGDIIYQEKFRISKDKTGADLLSEFNKRYPLIISKVIELIENKSLKPVKQDSTKATYFGKRTPEDGKINWNWQKERIRNWVRALARPYPGAFTYYKGNKIIINKIKFSDLGYSYEISNGTILAVKKESFTIKTPNGAVKAQILKSENIVKFKVGEILE